MIGFLIVFFILDILFNGLIGLVCVGFVDGVFVVNLNVE